MASPERWRGILLFILLLVLALPVITLQNKASGMHIELIRQFGTQEIDSPTDISVAPSGIYVLGQTAGVFEGQNGFPDDGADDGFLRKYDLEGNVNWTKQFSLAHPSAVSADPSGVYIAGGELDVASFEFDSLIAKYDSDGNVVWTREFGTDGRDWAQAIIVDSDSLYVGGDVSGVFEGETSSGGDDIYVRKYDVDGNLVWSRQFGTSEGDVFKSMSLSSDGIYVLGDTLGAFNNDTNLGLSDLFVAKFDFEGSNLWTRQFGTSGDDGSTSISADSSGDGIYFTGFTGGSFSDETSSDIHSFAIRVDSDGNMVWRRDFGNLSSENDFYRDIDVDETGVYIVGFTSNSTGFVEKSDFDGNRVWTKYMIDSLETLRPVIVSLHSSGIYVAGIVFETISQRDWEVFWAKIGTDDLGVPDDQPPQVDISIALGKQDDPLEDGVALTSTPISFDFQVQDNMGIQEVECRLVSSQGINTISPCEGPITYDTDLGPGDYTLVVDAVDTTGHHGTDEFHFTILGANATISDDITFSSLVVYGGDHVQVASNVTISLLPREEPFVLKNFGTIENDGIITTGLESVIITNYERGIIINNQDGDLQISWGALENSGTIDNYGLWQAGETVNQETGQLQNYADATLSIVDPGGLKNSGNVTNAGAMFVDFAGISNEGKFENSGTLTIDNAGMGNTGSFVNSGIVKNGIVICGIGGSDGEVDEVCGISVGTIGNTGTIINSGTMVNKGTISSVAGGLINEGLITRAIIVESLGPGCDNGVNHCTTIFNTHLTGAEVTISPDPFTLADSLLVQDNGPLDSDISYFELEEHADGIIVIGNVSTASYFLSETSVPQNFTTLYDDIGISFSSLLIQDRKMEFLHIDSNDSLADIVDGPLNVPAPDLREAQLQFYRDNAYVGLLAGIQDKILRPIEGVVDMEIADVQVFDKEGEVGQTFRIVVSYANSNLNGGDPSSLRLFQISNSFFGQFEDITLPDPEGHDLDGKTVTGETRSLNLLALAFEEPSLTDGFELVGGNFLVSKDSLPSAKIGIENTIDLTEPLVPSVVFTEKGSEELTAQELFDSYMIPTYPSIGQGISKDTIYVLPTFLVPQQESKNNFLVTPVLSQVHNGTTLFFSQSSFVESELARVEKIRMTLATEGHSVGLAFGVTDTQPKGTPPPPIDVPALFLNIDFIGDIDFSDPSVFESSPTIDILVNKTLPRFEQLDDGCLDFELLLFNEETEDWETVQKLRDPVQDTSSECSFTLSPGHFSKFGIGGVSGLGTTLDFLVGHHGIRSVIGPAPMEVIGHPDISGEATVVAFEIPNNVPETSEFVSRPDSVVLEMDDAISTEDKVSLRVSPLDNLGDMINATLSEATPLSIDGSKFFPGDGVYELILPSNQTFGQNLNLTFSFSNSGDIGSELSSGQGDVNSIRLLQYFEEKWIDVTQSIDESAGTISGSPISSSPMIIASVNDGTFGDLYFETHPLDRCDIVAIQISTISGVEDISRASEEAVHIRGNVTNLQRFNQTFSFIVQINDKDGITVYNEWNTEVIQGGVASVLSTQWIPEQSGEFDVTVFIWDSEGVVPLPLSKPYQTIMEIA